MTLFHCAPAINAWAMRGILDSVSHHLAGYPISLPASTYFCNVSMRPSSAASWMLPVLLSVLLLWAGGHVSLVQVCRAFP